jgi:hypothetical protein
VGDPAFRGFGRPPLFRNSTERISASLSPNQGEPTVLNIEKLETPETVTFSITIPKSTRDQAGLYAKLVNRSLSEVIGIMLDRFMERDKEFQKQLSEQPGWGAAPDQATRETGARP